MDVKLYRALQLLLQHRFRRRLLLCHPLVMMKRSPECRLLYPKKVHTQKLLPPQLPLIEVFS